MSDENVVEGLVATWSSLHDLGAVIADLDVPTRVPGWSVRDNYSHIIGTMSTMLHRNDDPAVDVPDAPHIRNDLGRKNEAPLILRRGRAASEVLAEFDELRIELANELSAVPLDELDDDVDFMGKSIRRGELLSIVLMDNWIHEQDIRSAVGAPGHVSGPAVDHSRDRMLRRISGRVVDQLSDGERVAVHVLPPSERRIVVTPDGAEEVSELTPSSDGDAEIRLDATVLAALAGGRVREPTDASEFGSLHIDGDAARAARALEQFAFTS